jgi:5-methylcytosine-specific restriction endonuclease McrA
MQNRLKDKKHIKWAKEVKDRDNYTCQICNKYNVYLHSHHLNSYDLFKDQRYLLENGITLCKKCHDMFHSIAGKGKNTKFQFEEFKQFVILIKKIAKE